jgi:predicted GNAT family N-acyltransferase
VDGLIFKLVENEDELAGAVSVRMRVFVVEQQIPAEEELDDADATATHAIALHQGQVVGTGRLIYREDSSTAQIGRMAVDQPFRRQGIGGRILDFLEEEARSQGIRRCILHAQEYVKNFYAAHGYQEHGDIFLEADIPHIEMHKYLGQ